MNHMKKNFFYLHFELKKIFSWFFISLVWLRLESCSQRAFLNNFKISWMKNWFFLLLLSMGWGEFRGFTSSTYAQLHADFIHKNFHTSSMKIFCTNFSFELFFVTLVIFFHRLFEVINAQINSLNPKFIDHLHLGLNGTFTLIYLIFFLKREFSFFQLLLPNVSDTEIQLKCYRKLAKDFMNELALDCVST